MSEAFSTTAQAVALKQALREELAAKAQEFVKAGGEIKQVPMSVYKSEDLTGNERRKMLTTRGFFCE